jgi:hypothetical protein
LFDATGAFWDEVGCQGSILVLKNFNSLQIFYSCRGQGEEMEFTDTAARKSVSCDMNFGIRANNVLLGFLRINYANFSV